MDKKNEDSLSTDESDAENTTIIESKNATLPIEVVENIEIEKNSALSIEVVQEYVIDANGDLLPCEVISKTIQNSSFLSTNCTT